MAAEDWIPDFVFEDEDSAWGGPRSKTCRRCGTRGLMWENRSGRWLLSRHDCRLDPRKEFENLDAA
jgi:hypothetical protein